MGYDLGLLKPHCPRDHHDPSRKYRLEQRSIFLEETKKATANSGRHPSDKKAGGQDEHPRKDIRSRASKYNKYTPLNVALSKLFREVS